MVAVSILISLFSFSYIITGLEAVWAPKVIAFEGTTQADASLGGRDWAAAVEVGDCVRRVRVEVVTQFPRVLTEAKV